MIKINNINISNLEAAIRGMRNPLQSWDRSDSHYDEQYNYIIGQNDLKLATNLVKAGSDERKFLRQIFVSLDITAPMYWWKEMDTYKVGTVANSTSTMHKVMSKEFALDDFSHDRLNHIGLNSLQATIEILNQFRQLYLYSKPTSKEMWWQVIQLLPSSYNQTRTWSANYEVLRNIYHARKNHKLDEWKDFCSYVESLPYAQQFIVG